MVLGKNSIEKKSIQIELSKDEYIFAIANGVNRAVVMEDKSTPVNQNETQSHLKGAVGEMMVCKYYGVQFDRTITPGYDGDVDMVIDDTAIDVKTFAHKSPDLLVKKSLVERGDAEVYILVRLRSEDPVVGYEGDIVGWEYSDYIQDNYTPKREPASIMNYKPDWRAIRNMPESPVETKEDNVSIDGVENLVEYMDIDWLSNDPDTSNQNGLNEYI